MSIEAAGYLTAKAAAAAGGLFGGLVMFAFMKPKTILDATIRGGVCTGNGIIFSPILCDYLGSSLSTPEHLLAGGAVIGFMTWGVLSMTARFFIKAEAANIDIVEAAKEIKK
jgi:hypothetical protein